MGFIVIPGISKVEHIRENFNILDFKLADDDMNEIAKISIGILIKIFHKILTLV